jgi:RNase H-like domain found in reverse transcriptase
VYETYDKELLAIVEVFKRWRHYLAAVESLTEVLCDYNNLKYFMTTTALNRRQARWALELLKYDFEIKY